MYVEENCFIENAANGNMVATAIGLYVNSYVYPTEEFYTRMAARGRNVQHNFTMLCLEWFRRLSECLIYDERNEASVKLAKRISEAIQYEPLERQKMANNWPSDCCFNFRNDAEAVRLFEKYLRLSEDNEEFIYTMLHGVHRTNQQSFSRLCLEWLKRSAEQSGRGRRYVVLARKAAKHYCYLPLV